MFVMLRIWALSVLDNIKWAIVEVLVLLIIVAVPITVTAFFWFMCRKVGWLMPDNSMIKESPSAVRAGVMNPAKRRQ